MLIVPFRRRLFAAGIVLALLPVLLSAAPLEVAKTKPVPSPTEKVRHDLDQTIASFKAPEGGSFKDALDYLADQKGLGFIIDERAFLSAGVNIVDGIKIKTMPEMKDVKVKEVLRAILGQIPGIEATYVVIGNKVVITTDKQAPYHWMQQAVNLDFEKEELSAALKKLARETGTNLVLDPRATEEVQTTVTLQVHDVTLETAVVLLAEMTGLKPVRIGNSLFLTTKANATEMRADPERASLIGPCPLPDGGSPSPLQ